MFKIIYADPPWTYKDPANAGQRGAKDQYPVMSTRGIIKLPCWDWADKDCLLAMWWTMPLAQEALDLVKFLGFNLKTMGGLTWVKTNDSGKHPIGMGHWTRTNVECCLFATRGRISRVDAGVPALIKAKRGEHSAKPLAAATALVRLMGDVPRLECFARDFKQGWHSWGNELPPSIHGQTRSSNYPYYTKGRTITGGYHLIGDSQ